MTQKKTNGANFGGSIDFKFKMRLSMLMFMCGMAAVMITFRAAFLQLFHQPKLESMARRQFISRSLIQPRRGSITDRNGEPLAISMESFSLAANPSKVENRRELARALSKSIGIPFRKILLRLTEENREFTWIKRHLTDGELRRFKKWGVIDSNGDLKDGLWMVKESNRAYPHKQLASHILGSVNVDSEGIEGVELWLNDRLRGKVVSVSAIKDALGRPTFIDANAARNIEDGESIPLTIDAALQFEVETELRNAVTRTGSRSGSVIVMNADNGEILAMANEPSFDPNEKVLTHDKRRNRAITDGYEPGSTLKAVVAATALNQGIKITDEVWGEKGTFILQKHRISEAEAHEKFEWVSLKKMLQVSSNIAAAKFALRIGAERFSRALHLFGFGTRTGVGFPGEIPGMLPPKKEWTPLTVANVGFGQGILVTPLQMTRAYAAILNGGVLVQPTLLKSPVGISDVKAPRIFQQRVSNEVLLALESVTQTGGTGTKAALPGYRVAGKTGTAQVVDSRTGTYSKEKYIASFIGFALGVEPKLVIYTALVEPKGGYYASETAAPLFREVLNSVANRCSLPVNLSLMKATLASQGAQKEPALLEDLLRDGGRESERKGDHLTTSQAVPERPLTDPLEAQELRWQLDPQSGHAGLVMPSLRGLTPREALDRIQGHRFEVELVGAGVVLSQIPLAGKPVAEGDTIRLVLSEP